MIIAKYRGGMFGSGANETLSCCLCGTVDYKKLIVHRLGISIGMSGNDYTFCRDCWNGANFGKRLLEFFGYPDGMYLREDSLDFTEISDEK